MYGIPADQSVKDEEWLRDAGRQVWVVLMKDDRIRYRQAERDALISSRVRAFSLASGNLTSVQMADCFLSHQVGIYDGCQDAGPFVVAVSAKVLRRVDTI